MLLLLFMTVVVMKRFLYVAFYGLRWLWTNGKISKDGWIPWDTEVQNAAPAMLLWRAGSTAITTRIPGLYK